MISGPIEHPSASAPQVHGFIANQEPVPLIFKVLSIIKSREQVIAMARDIARLTDRHMKEGIGPASLWTEGCDEICDGGMPHHVARGSLDKRIARWCLMPDEENFSPKARELLAVGDHDAVKALPEQERLYRRQAYHFVVSVRRSHEPTGGELLLISARQAVVEIFLRRGHQVLCALNKDTEHPNLRLLVNARSSRPPYRSLHFGRAGAELQEMKQTFVRHARGCSLNVVASTRKARAE